MGRKSLAAQELANKYGVAQLEQTKQITRDIDGQIQAINKVIS